MNLERTHPNTMAPNQVVAQSQLNSSIGHSYAYQYVQSPRSMDQVFYGDLTGLNENDEGHSSQL